MQCVCICVCVCVCLQSVNKTDTEWGSSPSLIPGEGTGCVLMTSRVSYMLHYTKVLLLCDKEQRGGASDTSLRRRSAHFCRTAEATPNTPNEP